MASIDDFVESRWTDAKATLAKLDQDFVSKVESEVRLQAAGLTTPWEPKGESRKPLRRLSSEWHRLLEACLELTMQEAILRVAADGLTRDATRRRSQVEIGKQGDYHFRSWFVHATTLTERVDDVINWTTKVYVVDRKVRSRINKRHQGQVYQQVTNQISRQRNSFVHSSRSWAKAMTEEELWEAHVAAGMTPRSFLDELHHPAGGEQLISGKYDQFVALTEDLCDCLGSILQDLELEVLSSRED